MNAAKLVLLFALVIVDAPALQASNPIKLVRQPFSNGEAIKLNMQAQEQMQKGDLTSAARTIELAMQKDPTLWLTYFMRAKLFERERKSVNFPVLITRDEIGIHLRYLLGNQTELRCICLVALVMECHGLERQNRFARFVHRFNFSFEAA
jgi:hypothetical protein